MKKGVIICVDDEKVVLHGLMSQLGRKFSEIVKIVTCESGEEALELIEQYKIEERNVLLVISDQLMPGIKGNELLRTIHKMSPSTCKILLTGQTDVVAVEDAIKNADLYRYLVKPWDGMDLILTVQQAIDLFERNATLKDQKEELEQHSLMLEKSVEERTYQLMREQERTDSLLLNILPPDIARELKETGHNEPKSFHQATVLFTDFKGFTTMASQVTPRELLDDLNECFSAFDEICDRHNMEKIKTIGDAYMCVGGVPKANSTNPVDALYTAWSMLLWTKEWNERRIAASKPAWEVRIGVHTGEVVAGVIGKKKFQYDLWGDAVNIASRMESSGEPGRINISSETYELVKDHFKCEYRGDIAVKNRGEIGMYFVDEIR